MEWLKTRKPEIAFDPAKLATQADWIRAGELVFNAPVSFGAVFFNADDLLDADFYSDTRMPVANDGTIP